MVNWYLIKENFHKKLRQQIIQNMPEKWYNHSRDNHSINMSAFYRNHVKHCMEYVETWVFSDPYLSVHEENLRFCPYMGKYGCDFNTDRKRLFCWRLKGGVHYDLLYLLWSYVGSLKLFRERWQHHKLDPKQSVTIFFLQKKLVLWKKLCTLNLINIPRYLNRIYLFIWLEIIAKGFNQICNGEN